METAGSSRLVTAASAHPGTESTGRLREARRVRVSLMLHSATENLSLSEQFSAKRRPGMSSLVRRTALIGPRLPRQNPVTQIREIIGDGARLVMETMSLSSPVTREESSRRRPEEIGRKKLSAAKPGAACAQFCSRKGFLSLLGGAAKSLHRAVILSGGLIRHGTFQP